MSLILCCVFITLDGPCSFAYDRLYSYSLLLFKMISKAYVFLILVGFSTLQSASFLEMWLRCYWLSFYSGVYGWSAHGCIIGDVSKQILRSDWGLQVGHQVWTSGELRSGIQYLYMVRDMNFGVIIS